VSANELLVESPPVASHKLADVHDTPSICAADAPAGVGIACVTNAPDTSFSASIWLGKPPAVLAESPTATHADPTQATCSGLWPPIEHHLIKRGKGSRPTSLY
jgi:hypothetical protein